MRKSKLDRIVNLIAASLDQEDKVLVVVALDSDAAEVIARLNELHPDISSSGDLEFQVILGGGDR